MALEIERKFLITSMSGIDNATKVERIRQGYLSLDIERTVRIRMFNETGAWLAVKGKNTGAVRKEFEYRIPESDGKELLNMCSGGYIDKIRYTIPVYHELVIEIDVFSGDNLGLVVAELELPEDNVLIPKSSEEIKQYLPDWIGTEVTDDPRYYNSALLTNPYKDWDEDSR